MEKIRSKKNITVRRSSVRHKKRILQDREIQATLVRPLYVQQKSLPRQVVAFVLRYIRFVVASARALLVVSAIRLRFIVQLFRRFVQRQQHGISTASTRWFLPSGRREFQLTIWPMQRLLRLGSVGVAMAVIVSIVLLEVRPALPVYAGTTPYDFSVSGDYTLGDNAKIEVSGGATQLKNQQYTGSEANSSALYHFDAASGNSAIDSTSNANTATFSTTSPCAGGAWGGGKIAADGITIGSQGSTTFSGAPDCLSAADSSSLSINGVNPQMTLEAYVKFSSAFDASANISQAILDKGNYRLYFDESDGKLKYELHDQATKNWEKVGGANAISGNGVSTNDGAAGSWRQFYPGAVTALIEYNGSLYIGTSSITGVSSFGTAEVWKYTGDGTTTNWTKIAGDGLINSNWDTGTYETVLSMVVFNSELYIGLGNSAGDGDLWVYNPTAGAGSTPTLLKAKGFVNAEEVVSLATYGTAIFAGTGSTAGDGDVWRCSVNCGTISGTWVQVGGDTLNSSWASATYERVRSMVVMGAALYIGLGDTAGDAEVWRMTSGTSIDTGTVTWGGAAIGGDTLNSSWANTTFEWVFSLATDGTNIYAGLGGTGTQNATPATCRAGTDGEVWKWNGSTWGGAPIGGDTATSWDCSASVAYETVRGLVYTGSTLYASLGDTAGDAEVFRYSGSGTTWTRIGGDGVNTSWDANYTNPNGTTNNKEVAYIGSFSGNVVVGTGYTGNQDAEVWRCTSCGGTPAWNWIGGRDWNSWGAAPLAEVTALAIHNGYLYAGFGNTNKFAVVWRYDGTTWTQVGGGNMNLDTGETTWEQYEYVRSMASYKGELYVGFGDTAQDADLWKLQTSNGKWKEVGGDGLNNGWTTAHNYEQVVAIAADDTYLYVGLGNTASDADVWRWNGTNWGANTSPNTHLNAIGGTRNDNNSNLNNSWGGLTTYERIVSMAIYNGMLYVGLGWSAGDAEVWRWNGTNWGPNTGGSFALNKLGGDAVNSSWANTTYEEVRSMVFIGTTLYVGLGDSADETSVGDAEVWACTGCTNTAATPSWSRVGGDNVNSSWTDTDYESVQLVAYNGDLYALLGSNNSSVALSEAGDAEVWAYSIATTTWSKVGGDGVGTPSSWPNTVYENVNAGAVWNGKLYIGLGMTHNAALASDAEVWELGSNTAKISASAQNSWTADTWYHIAATYDASTMKIYVNGVQDGASVPAAVTLADTTQSLNIGTLKSPLVASDGAGGFKGQLDEVRISSTARSAASFVLTRYPTSAQSVRVTTALSRVQKQNWNGFDATEVANGGSIGYRLSSDGGTTWKYYDGAQWSTSSSTSQVSTKAQVNANITSFDSPPIESGGLVWQAVLSGNGDQRVILDDVSVSYVNDTQAPDNPSSVTGNDGNWFSRSNPQFSWSAPSDNADTGNGEVASNIEGYYVYFGTNGSADPATLGSFQTATTYTASAIPDGDTSTYYLRIKTRDNAQNVSATAYDQFRDTTAPNNVTSVTGNANSGNWFNRANPVFTWTAPTDVSGVIGEIASGIKGYYVYFGTNANAIPRTAGTFVTATTYTASPIDPGDTQQYYFRIQTRDKALNTTSDVGGIYNAFTDSQAPTAVASVTGNNGAWFDRTNPQFTWTAPADNADTGNGEKVSGVDGYYVYFGTNASATPSVSGTFVSGTSYSGTPISGADTQSYYFRIQPRDRAFNVGSVYDAFRDTVAPSNVTTVSGNNGAWYNRSNPVFTWSAPGDSAGGGEQVSGINGYWVYFGTNPNAVPRTAGTFVTATTYTASPISASDSQSYYFRIQTRDNAMNVTSDIGGILDGFADTGAPQPVANIVGNDGAWYVRSNPVFTWTAPNDTANGGEQLSGINGYWVYFGTNAAAVPSVAGTFQTGTTFTATPISANDVQPYYLRIQARDNAMNLSTVTDEFRDTTAPNNIASVTSLSANGGAVITTNTWYNHASPEFSWSAPTDAVPAPNPTNEVASGVSGYYVYFGTTFNAVPSVSGTFQTGLTFTPSSMVSGNTYYLRIQSRDKALNPSSSIFDAFTYKFDNVGPSGPIVTAAPAGYSAVNDFTFFWVGSGVGGSVDPAPGSGFSGEYLFRVGSQAWSLPTTDTSINIAGAAYQEGANIFEIKARDVVGNEGPATSVTFYYSGVAPTPPDNLTVDPATSESAPSTSNSFSFLWDPPASSSSPVALYRFSVNKLPTATNTQSTPLTGLRAAPFATQQGKNTFYVVAEDEAGNINYDNPAHVDFYTLTPAPQPPTSVQIFDISNRDTQEYAISMKWTEPSKINGFDGYEVFRSLDNTTFTSAGTTKSPVFIDTNLESKVYYYKVRAKDNAGQYSIDSSTVSLTPTGRFTSPPKILAAPTLVTKSFSASVTWDTDRMSSSFVEYGPDAYHLGKSNGGDTIGTLDMVTRHTVGLQGLQPETTYYYQAVWVDQDGNRGQSDVLAFQTGLRPKISDVTVTNITLTSATINWVSTTVSTSTINFGPTKSFGQSISDTSGGGTTKHSMQLENLNDTTSYYFVITGKDLDDNALTSDEYSFTTLTRPLVTNFAFEAVKDAPTTSMKFTWTTNVPTTTIMSVSKVGGTPKTQSDAEYTTNHEMVVSNLTDLTPYTFQARSVDKYGNTATSPQTNFTTPDDSRPPKILNMTVEVRSSGVGATQKAQLVVNWETDEPGSSQVEYGPGISSDSYPSKTQEDPVLTTTHVVIVPELEPAKLYHLRAVSRDRAGNAGTSDDTTSITGKVQKSVVDIIITSLQRSLGFLSAVPGLGN